MPIGIVTFHMTLTRSGLWEKESVWLMICGDSVHCGREDIGQGWLVPPVSFLYLGRSGSRERLADTAFPLFPLVQSGIPAQHSEQVFLLS